MEFTTFGLTDSKSTGSVESLGGKGAGLVWLATEGVPVPPGFIISTDIWAAYDKAPKATMKEIAKTLPVYLAQLQQHFGYLPLLSVRSGARVSCPGMMDTILNVGIEPSNIGAWTSRLGPKCFGDSFARLIQMYGSVVKGIRKSALEGSLEGSLEAYLYHAGEAFPQAEAQLLGAIEAVFKSWDNDRADFYRKTHGYDRAWGTAVTVQAMVFGNLNEQSATGVLFTRNPNTGAMAVTGEWLANAQGEDIVAGVRTPLALDEMKVWSPVIHTALLDTVIALENKKREMLDIEFTIQDGSLYILQVRTGKRSATAAIKIAVDMTKQGLITSKTAIGRVSPKQLDLAQLPSLDPTFTKPAAFTGLPACSGIVTGKPVFSKEVALTCSEPCILVTHETTPNDIAGMQAARGVITMVGGATCHAAVVARGMDRACIVGVGASLDAFQNVSLISMDGATGRIWTEAVPIVEPKTNGTLATFHTMVTDALGVVPVIFSTPTHAMPEALLYLGDQILNPLKAAQTVLKALTFVDRLYLDLVPSAEEQKFFNIVSTHDHANRVLNLLQGALPEEHQLFDRLTVLVPANVVTTFNRLTPGAGLRDLVLAESEIMMDGVDTTDPAIQTVLAWKKSLGVVVVSVGAYVAGTKSMLSVPQALQLVGEVK